MSFLGRNEYDRGVNTFSPDGRLFQVEYAIEAIKLGSTSIGVCVKDGIILAVEKKKKSRLQESESIQKTMEIDKHIAAAMSGLTSDARSLVDHARNECLNHWFTYNESLSVESCTHAISDLALDFSDVSDGRRKRMMSRPFGVALLIGGVDKTGPSLWVACPSGTYTNYKAEAIGSAQEVARNILREQYKDDMTFAEAEVLAVGTLKEVMEEKINSTNVEVVSVKVETAQYKSYTHEEVEAVLGRVPATLAQTVADS